MDDLVAQLRSGIDNVDGEEMGGVVLTMRLAADEIEHLRERIELLVEQARLALELELSRVVPV